MSFLIDTDKNWKGFGPQDSGRIITPKEWQAPPADVLPTIDDLCKSSNVENLTFDGLDIPSSEKEDSIDAVRGKNYKWLNCLVHGTVTIKGSIVGWLFQDCMLKTDVEVGQFDNYWYWGRPPTSGGRIENCETGTDTRIEVILWDATAPDVVNSRVKITVIPKWIWLPYFVEQYLKIRVVNLVCGIFNRFRAADKQLRIVVTK